jgi:heme/copper-type cytochrome/quinol oxidase subunit 2
VIGSNPNTATTAGTPSAITAGGNLVFTFKRSDESEAFALYVEHSTTLDAPWTAIPVPVGAITGPPVTVVETDPKKFARLRADIPYTP